MTNMDDRQYMKLALELAEQGRGQTSPNPMVGAVIVKDGRIVGRGFHERAGLPHAEVNALHEAGELARGATLYVNLEPCCHWGRTPPCTEAIIESGIGRVVCAHEDPNPKVSSSGLEKLRQAGVEISVGVMGEEARRLNEIYIKYMTSGLPFVAVKIAQTLDGKIAAADGHSRWITGEASRRIVHSLRAQYDAVLVGINTVLSDDPELTVRAGKGRNPARIVLDGSLRIPHEAKLLNDLSAARTILATRQGADQDRARHLREMGAEIWMFPSGAEGRVDIQAVLRQAGEEEITSILIEGGGQVLSSCIRSRLADKAYLFIAPAFLGTGIEAVSDIGPYSLAEAICLHRAQVQPVGEDILITGYF